MNEFFTWEMLITFGGASIATGVFTQFLKPYLKKIPTQLISFFVALIVMVISTIALTGISNIAWADIAIIPLNSIIISLSSNGGYDVAREIKNSGNDE